MDSPRRITRPLNSQYIDEIMEITKNINLYGVSLLTDYKDTFNVEDITVINNCIYKIEEYIKLLEGYRKLLMQGTCHSSIHRKFKIVAQEIFEIEQILKKYSIKLWETQLTDIDKFENGDRYCYVAYSLLMDPNLKYKNDEHLIQEQYEKRMGMLSDSKRRFLSCSLLTDQLTRLFYDSHIAAIIGLDKTNYIAANYRDAATGDSLFTKNCASKCNYDDIYTVKRDELGNIFTGEPATIISTPKVIEHKQINDESAVTVNEIILDRMKSKTKGILCYVYGNKLLSYSRKFAEKLGKKYNLPVVCIDKMLYSDKELSEYELYEKFEIINGIQQFLDEETQDRIYHLSKDFDENNDTYLRIFQLANKEGISSDIEAKQVVEKITRQIIKQKEDELER